METIYWAYLLVYLAIGYVLLATLSRLDNIAPQDGTEWFLGGVFICTWPLYLALMWGVTTWRMHRSRKNYERALKENA